MGVITNAPRIADSVSGMTHGATLRQAVDRGSHDQWERDMRWTIDLITTTLTGDALDAQAVCTARDLLETQHFRKMQVYKKVPMEQARQSGQDIFVVRLVDVRRADGSHRSRLRAKEGKTYRAPELLAATPPIEATGRSERRDEHHAHRCDSGVLLHQCESRHLCEAPGGGPGRGR